MTPAAASTLQRVLAYAAMILVLLYAIVDVSLQFLPPHYSVVADAESDLAVGPYGWVMRANFLGRGVMSLCLVGAIVLSRRGAESTRGESKRGETTRAESTRGESMRGETTRGESMAGESSSGETRRGETTGHTETTPQASRSFAPSRARSLAPNLTRNRAATPAIKLGCALIVIAGVCSAMLVFFATDVNAAGQFGMAQHTNIGRTHVVFATIGFIAVLLGMLLLTAALPLGRVAVAFVTIAAAGLLILAGCLLVAPHLIGLAERLCILGILGWAFAVAYRYRRGRLVVPAPDRS
jgi:hypothetical membrane protein